MEINRTKRDLENRQPTRYELIDKDGKVVGRYSSILKIHQEVADLFPDQEQDEERSGKGWDIQTVGADR